MPNETHPHDYSIWLIDRRRQCFCSPLAITLLEAESMDKDCKENENGIGANSRPNNFQKRLGYIAFQKSWIKWFSAMSNHFIVNQSSIINAPNLISLPNRIFTIKLNKNENYLEHWMDAIRSFIVDSSFGKINIPKNKDYIRKFEHNEYFDEENRTSSFLDSLFTENNETSNNELEALVANDEPSSSFLLNENFQSRKYFRENQMIEGGGSPEVDMLSEIFVNIIFILGTLRTRRNDNDLQFARFDRMTKNLLVFFDDMGRYENILRDGVKNKMNEKNLPYRLTNDSGSISTLIRKTETLPRVDELLKNFMAFSSALQNRLFCYILRSEKLRIKIDILEKRRSNNDQLDKRYIFCSEERKRLIATIDATNSDINEMLKLTNNVRRTLIEIFSFLQNQWNEVNSSLSGVLRAFEAYRIVIPDGLQNIMNYESRCTDLLNTIDVVRNFDALILQNTEDAYQETIDLFFELDLTVASNRGEKFSNNPIETKLKGDENFALFKDEAEENDDESSVYGENSGGKMKRLYEDMFLCFLRARKNWQKNRIFESTHDLRAIVLSYFKVHTFRMEIFRKNKNFKRIDYYFEKQEINSKNRENTTTTNKKKPNRELNLFDILDKLLAERDEQSLEYYLTENPDEKIFSILKEKNLRLGDFNETILNFRESQTVFDINYLLFKIDKYIHKYILQKNDDRYFSKKCNGKSSNFVKSDSELLDEISRANDRVLNPGKTSWENLSNDRGKLDENELNSWPYKNIDPLAFTYTALRLSQLKDSENLIPIYREVSRYVFLLSWVLQARCLKYIENVPENTENSNNSALPSADSDESNDIMEQPNTIIDDSPTLNSVSENESMMSIEVEKIAKKRHIEENSSSEDVKNKKKSRLKSRDGINTKRIKERKKLISERAMAVRRKYQQKNDEVEQTRRSLLSDSDVEMRNIEDLNDSKKNKLLFLETDISMNDDIWSTLADQKQLTRRANDMMNLQILNDEVEREMAIKRDLFVSINQNLDNIEQIMDWKAESDKEMDKENIEE